MGGWEAGKEGAGWRGGHRVSLGVKHIARAFRALTHILSETLGSPHTSSSFQLIHVKNED